MEHHYWRAQYIYLYRTTLCCSCCGYTETHTASEAYVQLARGEDQKAIPLCQYAHEVGPRFPQLKQLMRETEAQLEVCPACFDGGQQGHLCYSSIYAPGSDRLPEDIELEIKTKKEKRKPPTLAQLLTGLSA